MISQDQEKTHHQSSSSTSVLAYESFAQLLNFLLLTTRRNTNKKNPSSTSNRRNWYECVITKHVEPGFVQSGLAICYIAQKHHQASLSHQVRLRDHSSTQELVSSVVSEVALLVLPCQMA